LRGFLCRDPSFDAPLLPPSTTQSWRKSCGCQVFLTTHFLRLTRNSLLLNFFGRYFFKTSADFAGIYTPWPGFRCAVCSHPLPLILEGNPSIVKLVFGTFTQFRLNCQRVGWEFCGHGKLFTEIYALPLKIPTCRLLSPSTV
jgi:hypothetical protein